MSRTTFIEEAEAFLARLREPSVPQVVLESRPFVEEQLSDMIARARANDLPPRGERARGLWRTLDHWPIGREPGGDLANELARLEQMYEII